ncbi:class II aldolase/adducin family protein [Advenella sp. FME57]|uniref:class II aldolase/adducin family protein n=1 Tax=Advenella sp. FME57 TaxID=2742604 RepID=UPI00351C77C7
MSISSQPKDIVSEYCDELSIANHILYVQGVLDAFGHVSVRHPERPDHFLISRNRAPALVTPDDIQVLDLVGSPVEDTGVSLYLERYIHAAIYAADPEVMSVVHNHSPAVVPFTVSKNAKLQPVCHMSGFLSKHIPNFEIREFAGNGSNLLIDSLSLGVALANCKGKSPLVLMRGHGVTITGSSIPEAVFRSIYTEKGARLQMEAERLGECEYLTPEEAATADKTAQGQIKRAWDLWCWELKRQKV